METNGTHLLVVIDHREAKIYSADLRGPTAHKITPYDPHGFGRTMHSNQDDGNGKRKQAPKAFYEAVAKTLEGAEQILLFGTGSGSTAMSELLADLKKHHHELPLASSDKCPSMNITRPRINFWPRQKSCSRRLRSFQATRIVEQCAQRF